MKIGIGRAGNVIGGGDWAKDRIVPDFMRAWSNKYPMEIRSPNSTRPWQHVLEPLSGYLTLARCLDADEALHKEAFNFGPPSDQNCTVEELTSRLAVELGTPHWEVCSPKASVKEANLLKLNCEKAFQQLRWEPTLSLAETTFFTADWYRNFYDENTTSTYEFSSNQIGEYMKLAISRNKGWAI